MEVEQSDNHRATINDTDGIVQMLSELASVYNSTLNDSQDDAQTRAEMMNGLIHKLETAASNNPTSSSSTGSTASAQSQLLSIVTPSLFTPSKLSSDVALSALTALVAYKPTSYLILASRAVKQQVEQTLAMNSSTASTQSGQTMEVSDSLLNVFLTQLQSTSTEVADNTTNVLLKLCNNPNHPANNWIRRLIPSLTLSWKELLHQFQSNNNNNNNAPTRQQQKQAMNHLSTIAIRLASLLVSIITISSSSSTAGADVAMQMALEYDSLNVFLLDMLIFGNVLGEKNKTNEDALLQMSVLDLIEQMTKTTTTSSSSLSDNDGDIHMSSEGNTISELRMEWLTSSKVLEPLLQLAGGSSSSNNDTEEGTPHMILGGNALRILSSICALLSTSTSSSNQQTNTTEAQTLLLRFHKALHTFTNESSGENDRIALVDAISSFASTSEQAMRIVLDDEILYEGWLDVVHVSQSKLKAVVLYSIARVMDQKQRQSNIGEDEEGWKTCIKLFQYFGKVNNHAMGPTGFLLDLTKSPLVEVRLGAYELLRSFASAGTSSTSTSTTTDGGGATGAHILFSHAGFLEFLKSREGESVKEGKEAKHLILEAILKSRVRGVLAENVVKDLERIYREGPFHVKGVAPQWEIATE